MKIPDFFKRRAVVLSDFQSLISEKPPVGLVALYQISNRIFETYDRTSEVDGCQKTGENRYTLCDATLQNTNVFDAAFDGVTATGDETGSGQDQGLELDNAGSHEKHVGDELSLPNRLFYFHVMSKCHVNAFILARPEAKTIFEGECLHYGRVCEIAITNYCIMDNHFHLNVGVPAPSLTEARKKLAKMMGSIKQQFTKRFKVWYNTVYRKEIRQRKPKLGNGSMWAGPIRTEYIKDEAQLAASTLYIEANRIKVSCAEQIAVLCEPPRFKNTYRCDNFGAQAEYRPLLDALYENRFQSAHFYLAEDTSHPDTALTDGLDGNWATAEEVQKHWHLPACSLPSGWRKVHYGSERRILKPTAARFRTYHTTAFVERLGKTPMIRRKNFARLVLGMCWKSRARIAADNEVVSEYEEQGPGIGC